MIGTGTDAEGKTGMAYKCGRMEHYTLFDGMLMRNTSACTAGVPFSQNVVAVGRVTSVPVAPVSHHTEPTGWDVTSTHVEIHSPRNTATMRLLSKYLLCASWDSLRSYSGSNLHNTLSLNILDLNAVSETTEEYSCMPE